MGQTKMQAELCPHLRRAGIDATIPADAPGPWAQTLVGRWQEASRLRPSVSATNRQSSRRVGPTESPSRSVSVQLGGVQLRDENVCIR